LRAVSVPDTKARRRREDATEETMGILMRVAVHGLWVALAVLLIWTAPVAAEDGASDADRSAIQQVIARQMAAFKRDDGVEAFSYASPGIRAMFGSVERFMAMVKAGYMPVYRPREATFEEVALLRGQPVQKLLIVGPDGAPVVALYTMEMQPDGAWRIDGVVLVPLPDKVT